MKRGLLFDDFFSCMLLPSKKAQAVMLQTCIQKEASSILVRDTDSPSKRFSWLSSHFQVNARLVSSNIPRQFTLSHFKFTGYNLPVMSFHDK
jgi:hypothetical protein